MPERAGSVMLIRSAMAADAPVVAEIHEQSFLQNNGHAHASEALTDDFLSLWRTRLSDPGAHQLVLIASDGARVSGFVCAFGAQHPQWGSLVDNIHVSSVNRATGIGSRLMQETRAWLIEHYRHDPVHLFVLESNVAARAFYEKLGARRMETKEMTSHAGGRVTNCRYAWDDPDQIRVDRG